MPRNTSNDSPMGAIITSRLEEIERSQMWLARQTSRCTTTINQIVKGRLKPSKALTVEIARLLEIEPETLLAVRSEWKW
ncbi:MAG: hypothetical protein ACI4JB_01970 [Porcipelethomonas sp.]